VTLEQLRVFVAVAERQHVTQAAQALHLAQSAASAAIATLEARHGTKLFHRVGRGIELTEAGTVFLVEARAVLARAAAAELTLAELGGLRRGTLSVQASQTIASYWLPRHLVAFRRAYPEIEIRLAVGNTAQVAAAVHDGAAELGFVEGAVADPLLDSVTVARDRLVLVVGPDHPWAGRPRVAFADLADSEWVLREPGSGTRSAFEAALAAASVAPLHVALELPSNEAVRAAVEAGMGATVISASVAAPSIETGSLVRIGLDLPERDFSALRHRERYRSKATDALLALIAGPTPRRADGSAPGRSPRAPAATG
jgi:DNA-binding transcriptional LysR family regulator